MLSCILATIATYFEITVVCETEELIWYVKPHFWICVHARVCVCVCVWEREYEWCLKTHELQSKIRLKNIFSLGKTVSLLVHLLYVWNDRDGKAKHGNVHNKKGEETLIEGQLQMFHLPPFWSICMYLCWLKHLHI